MEREFDGRVVLRGVGYSNAIKAEKLEVGDIMQVNHGEQQKILNIVEVSKCYILIEFEYKSIVDNQERTSSKKIKKDRLVPVFELHKEENKKEFDLIEEKIEEVEQELLHSLKLKELILDTNFNYIELECIKPFHCGKYNVKTGYKKSIDTKTWDKYKNCDYFESCGAVHLKGNYKIIQDATLKTEKDKLLYNKYINLIIMSNKLLRA